MARFRFLFLHCLILHYVGAADFFRFSTYFSDHMVLQKGNNRQYVWGKSSKIGDTVSLEVIPHGSNGKMSGSATVDHNGNWMIKINFHIGTHYGPYTLNATSSLGSAVIDDVLFGDVWICSGQSNMEFNMFGLTNTSLELTDANNYATIRLFRAANVQSNTPLEEFQKIQTHWTLPTSGHLGGFSAVCWLYGKYLSQHLNYPLGLIETNWGGTRIQAWSSPDALAVCHNNRGKRALPDSSLWNAMINPLLKVPIYGAIWYQDTRTPIKDRGEIRCCGMVSISCSTCGTNYEVLQLTRRCGHGVRIGESNMNAADKYACQFPAMISDWRSKFSQASHHGTNARFPFGFVQLAPFRAGEEYKGFPEIRWSQTAQLGTVPNARMPNTFMAVAMDLPDFSSPFGSIHPRFKHDVAARLVLSAVAIAYHQNGVDYQGPYPSSYTKTNSSITIEYSHGVVPLDVRSNTGFEVCCSTHSNDCDKSTGNWKPAPVSSHDTSTVTLSTANCDGHGSIAAVRYAWRESPCGFKQCAVYGADNDLPGPPFFHRF